MHTDFPLPSPARIPLTANAGITPVLLLDGNRACVELQDCADMRLNAARGLLHSLASMTPGDVDGRDLMHIADAAQLLLTDACDLVAAARKAARREARR